MKASVLNPIILTSQPPIPECPLSALLLRDCESRAFMALDLREYQSLNCVTFYVFKLVSFYNVSSLSYVNHVTFTAHPPSALVSVFVFLVWRQSSCDKQRNIVSDTLGQQMKRMEAQIREGKKEPAQPPTSRCYIGRKIHFKLSYSGENIQRFKQMPS